MNTFLKDFLKKEFHEHKRNFANTIGVIETGGGGCRPWVLQTLIYEGVNLERGGSLVWFLFLEGKKPRWMGMYTPPPPTSDACAHN